jgi:ABC-2 type transport system ATP-binding protein
MHDALVVSDVCKRYDDHVAVSELSLVVPSGRIYGILGPNGAGKTTILRMVMNIIARDSGRISLLGADPATDRGVLRRVGYLPEERGLYKGMTAIDAICFFGRLKGMSARLARRAARAWLARMGLADWSLSKVDSLSKGMQQKVQFIATIVHQPELLILDEPAAGLDPVNQQVLRDAIVAFREQGGSVVFSTHNMDQAEQLCDDVCVIAGGRKVLDGPLQELKRTHAGNRYRVRFESATTAHSALIEGATGPIEHFERREAEWELDLRPGATVQELLAALNTPTSAIRHFSLIEPTLHEMFLRYASGAAVAARRQENTHA